MRFFKLHQRRIALLLALTLSGYSGSLVFAVQVFAWAKMSVNFLKHDAPQMALRKTFDEKHPCEICKHLREVRAKNAKAPWTPVQCSPNASEQGGVADLAAPSFRVMAFELMTLSYRLTHASAASRIDSPITPPPRLFLSA